MLQPFEPFTPVILRRLIKLNRFYLVSQSYPRAIGAEGNATSPLLLTDYNDPGGARIHLNAVRSDRYAAFLNLQNPLHAKKLDDLLLPGSPYQLFFAVVRSAKAVEQIVTAQYRDAVRKYIDRQTDWRLNRDTNVRVNLELTFGQLFMVLKHSRQTIRVKLEDIEAMA